VNLNPSQCDFVFVIDPTNHLRFRQWAIPDATSAETPFGSILFDVDCAEDLFSHHSSLFEKMELGNAEEEHSLEMEFPLLKFGFDKVSFKIGPIIVGDFSAAMADALRPFTDDPRTVVIVSNDFSHWGHFSAEGRRRNLSKDQEIGQRRRIRQNSPVIYKQMEHNLWIQGDLSDEVFVSRNGCGVPCGFPIVESHKPAKFK
jgi:AmmeMemoRadiSam system protein B